MPLPLESLEVAKLPRPPFLPHSEQLLGWLLSSAPAGCEHILEVGCGRRSPLLPMLTRRWPAAKVHQIDARSEVLAEAARHNPQGQVEQMLASNMATVASGSKQLVVAMSVFDQNPTSVLAQIAGEIHRVLSPEGVAVYMHNEELNLPATAASQLGHSPALRLLLPSDHWEPTNDFEYCAGDKAQIEAALRGLGSDGAPLQRYLQGIFPQLYGQRMAQSTAGEVAVPFLRECTYPVMSRIRRTVATLRQDHGVPLVDYRTPDLLCRHVEDGLFCPAHGFEIVRGGVFELRRAVPWQTFFKERPPATCFVRGIARFGYSCRSIPEAVGDYAQDLNSFPVRGEDELLFIAYQYGVVVKKNG